MSKFIWLCGWLGVTLDRDQVDAGRWLESQGYSYPDNFGHDTVVDKAVDVCIEQMEQQWAKEHGHQ